MPFHLPWSKRPSLWQRLKYRFTPHPSPKRLFWRQLSLIITLTALALSLFFIRLRWEFRRQAQLTPTAVPLLAEFTLDPASQKITLTRAHRLTVSEPDSATNLVDLQFIDSLQGEDWASLLGQPQDHVQDPRHLLPKPIAVTTLNYQVGKPLKFKGSVSIPPQQIDAAAAETAVLNQIPPTLVTQSLNPGENIETDLNHFKLLYISSAYTDPRQFKSDAAQIDAFFRTVPPFNTYSNYIQSNTLYTPTDLGCYRSPSKPRLIQCDLFLIRQAASGQTYDSIVVIHNSDDYGGSGYLGQNVAVTYRDTSALAKQVMVHEFGHSFGNLQDEYSYNLSWPNNSPPPWVNCDFHPCTKWTGVPNTACHQVCAYTNLFRPTYNDSLMRSLFPETGFHFSPESIYHLTARLSRYTGFSLPLSDLDIDQDTDFLDYNISIQQYGRSGSADNNLDGLVDLFDLNVINLGS